MVFIPVTFKKWPKSKFIEISKFHFVKCLDGYLGPAWDFIQRLKSKIYKQN